MSFLYTQLTESELSIIQNVGRQTYEPYYSHLWKPGGVDWYMEQCFGLETLNSELKNPNVEYWLAADQSGSIVGFLKLLLKKPLPEKGLENALYLEKIYLMPAFFGKGNGRIMMEFVRQRAITLRREAIWLMVLKSGPVKAYEKAGFQIVGAVHWDFELLLPAERGGWVMMQVL